MGWQDEDYFTSFQIGLCGLDLVVQTMKGHSTGKFQFIVQVENPDDFLHPVSWFQEFDTPTEGYEYITIPISVAIGGTTALRSRTGVSPIGEKGATHAKESLFEDQWIDAEPAEITVWGETKTVNHGEHWTAFLLPVLILMIGSMQAQTIGLKYAMA